METPMSSQSGCISSDAGERAIHAASRESLDHALDPLAEFKDGSKQLEGEAGGSDSKGKHQDSEEDREDAANEVAFEEGDPANPLNFSFRKKIAIIGLMSLLTVNVTFASSAPSSATAEIAKHFNLSGTLATFVTTSIFLLGYCVGPLLWSTFSELWGRRIVFIYAMGGFTIFIIGQPLAKNAQTFAITRFLSGLAASAPLTNAGGVIVDMTDACLRGYALSFFSAAVFAGPVLGPLVGSFATQQTGDFRIVFWVMFAFAAVCWLLVVFLLPETFVPVLLMRKAQTLRAEGNAKAWAAHERLDWSASSVAKRTLMRPYQILFMEPILVLITVYLSIVYGLLYSLFESVPIIFSEIRGFNLGQTGLCFIPVLIGTTLGAGICIALGRKYEVLEKVWKNSVPPEERLAGGFVAAPCLVLGILMFGISGNYASVHWIVPAIALVPIGLTFTAIFVSLLSYVGDSYLLFAASALASNTMIRSALGAAFPLFTPFMWNPKGTLGPLNSALVLGAIALVLSPSPFLFYRFGPRVRKLSKFAPCADFAMREELEREGILPHNSFNKNDRESRTGRKAWLLRESERARGANLQGRRWHEEVANTSR